MQIFMMQKSSFLSARSSLFYFTLTTYRCIKAIYLVPKPRMPETIANINLAYANIYSNGEVHPLLRFRRGYHFTN